MPKIHLKVREKIFEYEAGLTLETISRDFQKAYPHDIILARVDGKLAELMKTIDEDVSVEFITTGEIIGNELIDERPADDAESFPGRDGQRKF